VVLGHGHPEQGHPIRQCGGDATPDRPSNDLTSRHCVTPGDLVENLVEVASVKRQTHFALEHRIQCTEIDDHPGVGVGRSGDGDRHPVQMSVTRRPCTPTESSLRLGVAPAAPMHSMPGVECEPPSERDPGWLGQNATPIPIVSAGATTYWPVRPVGFTACGSSLVPGSSSGSSVQLEGYFNFHVN